MALQAGRTTTILFMVRLCSLAGQIGRARIFLASPCGMRAGRELGNPLAGV